MRRRTRARSAIAPSHAARGEGASPGRLQPQLAPLVVVAKEPPAAPVDESLAPPTPELVAVVATPLPLPLVPPAPEPVVVVLLVTAPPPAPPTPELVVDEALPWPPVPPSAPASARGLQVPDWHSPSEHIVPSLFSGLEHTPLVGSQTPASWQSSKAEQTTRVFAVHMPAWQLSSSVQALPSSQDELSALAGLEHRPVAESQAPITWH